MEEEPSEIHFSLITSSARRCIGMESSIQPPYMNKANVCPECHEEFVNLKTLKVHMMSTINYNGTIVRQCHTRSEQVSDSHTMQNLVSTHINRDD